MQLSPLQQYTEFITREHDCPCDVLVTAGTHHLRFWSFRRPQANGLGGDVDGREPSLKFKGGVYPRAGPAGGGLGGGGAVPSKPPSLYRCMCISTSTPLSFFFFFPFLPLLSLPCLALLLLGFGALGPWFDSNPNPNLILTLTLFSLTSFLPSFPPH